MTKRSHYKERIAFAEGFDIEFKNNNGEWEHTTSPVFVPSIEYRIKNPFQHIVDAFDEGKRIEYKYNNGWKEWDRISGPILPDATDSVWNPDIYDWSIIEEYKEGDWVKLVSKRPDVWVSDMDKYLGTAIKISGFYLGNRMVVVNGQDWYFWTKNIERLATKEEILNSPYYDGSLTSNDFKFEVGDYIVSTEDVHTYRKKGQVFKIDDILQGCIYYKKSIGSIDLNSWRYATKEEIFHYQKKNEIEYVPFEWEDREQLRGKWVYDNMDDVEFTITNFNNQYKTANGLSFDHLLKNCEFLDGSVCGKLKNN